jgi:hypothetical protein
MDLFISLKVLTLGIIWTGSFYLIAAYIMPIFPMPALLYIRKRLQLWSDNIMWLDEEKAKKRWKRSKGFFKFLVLLVWLGLMAISCYMLIPVLSLLVLKTDPVFWFYYGIAAIFPLTFGLYCCIRVFRNADKNRIVDAKVDDRPALKRIEHPII